MDRDTPYKILKDRFHGILGISGFFLKKFDKIGGT
jgi:hypothetical protein